MNGQSLSACCKHSQVFVVELGVVMPLELVVKYLHPRVMELKQSKMNLLLGIVTEIGILYYYYRTGFVS